VVLALAHLLEAPTHAPLTSHGLAERLPLHSPGFKDS